MLIEFTKSQLELLKNGNVIMTEKGVYRMFPPYWYKETVFGNKFEIIGFDYLPDDLKEAIKEMREKIKDVPENLEMNYEDE